MCKGRGMSDTLNAIYSMNTTAIRNFFCHSLESQHGTLDGRPSFVLWHWSLVLQRQASNEPKAKTNEKCERIYGALHKCSFRVFQLPVSSSIVLQKMNNKKWKVQPTHWGYNVPRYKDSRAKAVAVVYKYYRTFTSSFTDRCLSTLKCTIE